MKVNFADVWCRMDWEPLPGGRYLCRLVDIRDQSSSGEGPWTLIWAVVQGPHAGRRISDQLRFGPADLPSVRLLYASLGLPLAETMDVRPVQIIGRLCEVEVVVDDAGHWKTGPYLINVVVRDGYADPFPARGRWRYASPQVERSVAAGAGTTRTAEGETTSGGEAR
jgi:hypothetical protein